MKNLLLKAGTIFAVLGFMFSSRTMVLFLNSLTPAQGLVVYYGILFVTLEILQYFGLVVAGVRLQSLTQTIGELLIIFAFFIIVDFESAWVAYVTGKKTEDVPTVYIQAEDGAVFYMWNTYVTSDPEKARVLTYVVTPVLLVTLGLYLTGGAQIRRELLA